MSAIDGSDHLESLSFRGLARVDLASLNFDFTSRRKLHVESRKKKDRKVGDLVRVFRTDRCRRDKAANYLTVLVKRQELDAALELHGVGLPNQPPAEWCSLPILRLSFDCLDGRRRVLAGRQFLDKNDQWWSAKVYTEDLPIACCTNIAEAYSNESAYPHGIVFRKIRQYRRDGDDDREQQWWSRLSKDKWKDLRQLLKDKRFSDVFDEMLQWPGLVEAIDSGPIRRLVRLKCDEEQLSYLRAVISAWSAVLAGVSSNVPPDVVDAGTVRELETLCPKVSSEDAQLIAKKMDDRSIFPSVRDRDDRQTILTNVLDLPMIPSLTTFMEDLKYVEPCVELLRKLLPANETRSVRQAFFASYFRPDVLSVEHALHDIRPHPSQSLEHDRDIGYAQIWLCAFRDAVIPKRDGLGQQQEGRCGPLVQQSLARTAISVGFRTEAAERLAAQSGEEVLAAQMVSYADIGNVGTEDVTRRIVEILRQAPRLSGDPTKASFGQEERLPPHRRYGRPFEQDHARDRLSLLLPVIHEPVSQTYRNVSTLYCKAQMFQRFLGTRTISSPGSCAVPDGASAASSRLSLSVPAPIAHIEAVTLPSQPSPRSEHLKALVERNSVLAGDNRRLEAMISALKEAKVADDVEASRRLRDQQTECVRLRNALTDARTEKESLQVTSKALEEQLEGTRNALSTTREQNRQMSSLVKEVEDNLAKSNAEISSTKGRNSSLQDQVKSYQKDKQKHDGDLHTANERVGTLCRENARLETEVENLRRAADLGREETDRLQKQIQQLWRRIDVESEENARLESRTYGAEVQQKNDRVDFEAAYSELQSRSHEAELQWRENENLLTETLSRMDRERDQCRPIASTNLEVEFWLLRLVSYQASKVRIRDCVLSLKGLDELLKVLEGANYKLSDHTFLVGKERDLVTPADLPTIREQWHQRRILWVLPSPAYSEVSHILDSSKTWNETTELESLGLLLPQQITESESRRQPDEVSSPRRLDRTRSRSPARKRLDRKRSRSRSPAKDTPDRVRSRNSSRTNKRKDTRPSPLLLEYLPSAFAQEDESDSCEAMDQGMLPSVEGQTMDTQEPMGERRASQDEVL